MKPNHWSPFQPLWVNPSLAHIRLVPGPQVWARFGIQRLKDIMHTGMLLPFKDLLASFRLQRWMYFRYLQKQHAVRSQFPDLSMFATDKIEGLLAQESLTKPSSALYVTLLRVKSPKMDRLWEQWQADIPTLDREACFEDSSKLVIASRDKLIQTKFLHSVFLTPQNLHRIYPQRSYDRGHLLP